MLRKGEDLMSRRKTIREGCSGDLREPAAPHLLLCVLRAGDETQVNLAILQASGKDAGVYRSSISNQYGTDSTALLLSADSRFPLSLRHKRSGPGRHSSSSLVLAGMELREDLGGEKDFRFSVRISCLL